MWSNSEGGWCTATAKVTPLRFGGFGHAPPHPPHPAQVVSPSEIILSFIRIQGSRSVVCGIWITRPFECIDLIPGPGEQSVLVLECAPASKSAN